MTKARKPPRGKRGRSAAAKGEAPPAVTKNRKAPKAPVNYSAELGQRICDLVAEGGDVSTICKLPGMPTDRAVRKWTKMHEDFAAAMEEAREQRANVNFDALRELQEDIRSGKVAPNEGRVTFDILKFRIQQDGRRRYGDRPIAMDLKLGVGIQTVDTAQWLQGVLAAAEHTNVVPLPLLPAKREPTE